MTDNPTSPTGRRRKRIPQLLRQTEKITVLTAYDGAIAPILEAGGVDALLIGDSIGNVSLGYASTLPVTLEDIERATAAVERTTTTPLIIADLPFGSFEESHAQAFASSARLMKVGAQTVKVEGARPDLVRHLTSNGIPVMGHLGYTPQAEHLLGGPSLQGVDAKGEQLLADAVALAEAGAWSVVLEMVPAQLAAQITAVVPTIGIGAGPDCDGQVLVWSDMAGLTAWSPSFAKRFAEMGEYLREATAAYVEETRAGTFPGPKQTRER